MNFENIKVEGDINFNDELFKAIVEDSDDEDNSSNKKCLISLEPLNKFPSSVTANSETLKLNISSEFIFFVIKKLNKNIII